MTSKKNIMSVNVCVNDKLQQLVKNTFLILAGRGHHASSVMTKITFKILYLLNPTVN